MIDKVETLMNRLGSGEVASSPMIIRTLASAAMPSTSPGDDDDEDAPDTLSLEEAVPGPMPSLEDMTAVVAYVVMLLPAFFTMFSTRRTKEVVAMWENLKSTAKTPTTLKEGATTQPLLVATPVPNVAAGHAPKRQRCA